MTRERHRKRETTIDIGGICGVLTAMVLAIIVSAIHGVVTGNTIGKANAEYTYNNGCVALNYDDALIVEPTVMEFGNDWFGSAYVSSIYGYNMPEVSYLFKGNVNVEKEEIRAFLKGILPEWWNIELPSDVEIKTYRKSKYNVGECEFTDGNREYKIKVRSRWGSTVVFVYQGTAEESEYTAAAKDTFDSATYIGTSLNKSYITMQ